MKSFIIIKSVAIVVMMLFSAIAMSQNNSMKDAVEAAQKGKQDLLEILRSGRDLNIGVSADELERARAGTPVPRKMLNFDQMLNMKPDSDLSKMVKEAGSKSVIVPFGKNMDVATIVVVAPSEKGYEVAGLGGTSVAQDLSRVMKASGSSNIVAYEVPNLQTTIYAVTESGQGMYYTSFQGNSIRRGVSASALFPALQQAAQKFQQEYGDKVKDQRLVR